MPALFISHSSRDRAATEAVSRWLQRAGFATVFVDFDPERGIPAGRNWERELYAQLRRTEAVVFIATRAATASRWCFAELSLARSLGHPVFPLVMEPGVSLPLLADVQWIDLTDADLTSDGDGFVQPSGLLALLAGLRAAGLDPADAFAWDPRRSPYPGLAPFDPEDAAVFFARERETERLLELLHPTLQRGAGRFVAVVGPSGSGKSSLLRAGLLPRLARSPTQWILVPPLRPGSRLPTTWPPAWRRRSPSTVTLVLPPTSRTSSAVDRRGSSSSRGSWPMWPRTGPVGRRRWWWSTKPKN